MKNVNIGSLSICNDAPLTLIAGPCQLESADHAQMIAGTLAEACAAAGMQYVFKGSYDKANRTSLNAPAPLGLDKGLTVLEGVRNAIGCPVITDIHNEDQCEPVASIVDIMQIPAFLCRQTALLLAAGRSGAAINIKKGQFLAPWDMANVVAKVESTGNNKLLLTERGASFGYNNLVVDMCSLPEMARTGYPVVMDATHAVAKPGGLGSASGGQRELAPVLARAAVSLGIAALFTETHEDPDNAPCDGPNMIYLRDMPALIENWAAFDKLAKSNPIRL